MTPNPQRRVTFGEASVQQYDDNQSPNNLPTTLTRTASPLSRGNSPTSILSRIQRVTAPTMGSIEDNINYDPPNLQVPTTSQSDNGEGSSSQTLTTTSQSRNQSSPVTSGNFGPQDSQVSTEFRSGVGGGSRTTTTTTFTQRVAAPVVSVQHRVIGFPALAMQGHHRRHHHHHPHLYHSQEYQQMAQRQLHFDTLSVHERILQERWAQTQLSMTHEPCVLGYDWYRVPGGYECYGGQHGVPDSLLIEGMGGYMIRDIYVDGADWYGPVYSREEERSWIEDLVMSGRWRRVDDV